MNPIKSDQRRNRTIRSEIHKFINSICNKEELPEEWKGSIIIPINNKGVDTGCSKQQYITVGNTHRILSSILLSSLTPRRENYLGSSVWISAQ